MRCPRCGSEAIYKYGFSEAGKQRYRCQICLYQFVMNPSKTLQTERPHCPLCGAAMHIHHRREGCTAYRCSEYPRCRGYVAHKNDQEDSHCQRWYER